MNTDLLVWATKQTGWCSPSSDCDGVHLRMNCPCADPGRFIMLWGPLNNSSETLQHHQRRKHASNIYTYIFTPSERTPNHTKHDFIWYARWAEILYTWTRTKQMSILKMFCFYRSFKCFYCFMLLLFFSASLFNIYICSVKHFALHFMSWKVLYK